MEELKRAIIVAAGEGKRLRPVSLETPKPLVRVNGTRLIDTEINALKQNGIHEIIIVAGYKKNSSMKRIKMIRRSLLLRTSIISAETTSHLFTRQGIICRDHSCLKETS